MTSRGERPTLEQLEDDLRHFVSAVAVRSRLIPRGQYDVEILASMLGAVSVLAHVVGDTEPNAVQSYDHLRTLVARTLLRDLDRTN